MKRLLKAALRPFKKAAGVLVRPVLRRFEHLLVTVVRDPLHHHVESVRGSNDHGVAVMKRELELLRHDVDLALNATIREVARLEMQVEELRAVLEQVAERDGLLATADEG